MLKSCIQFESQLKLLKSCSSMYDQGKKKLENTKKLEDYKGVNLNICVLPQNNIIL